MSIRRMTMRIQTLASLALIALAACGLVSCGDSSGDSPAAKNSSDYREIESVEEAVTVAASVDQAQVNLGDSVRYSVRVSYLPSLDIEFPAVLNQFENSVLIDPGLWEEEPSVGGRKIRRISVEFDPGIGPVLTIPASRIRWRKFPEDPWEEARTEEITVEVISVAADPSEFLEPDDLFEIAAPELEADGKDQRLLAAIIGGVLLLLVLIALWLFRQRKAQAVVPPSAEEVARRELEYLESLGLIAAGRGREYFYRLAGILRRYIEVKYSIRAAEQTSEEFLVALDRSGELAESSKPALRAFVGLADVVRYARHEPGLDESDQARAVILDFVAASEARMETETTTTTEEVHAL